MSHVLLLTSLETVPSFMQVVNLFGRRALGSLLDLLSLHMELLDHNSNSSSILVRFHQRPHKVCSLRLFPLFWCSLFVSLPEDQVKGELGKSCVWVNVPFPSSCGKTVGRKVPSYWSPSSTFALCLHVFLSLSFSFFIIVLV